MKNLFQLQTHGTTVAREIRAGLTTFFAMAYIIFVNPVFLSATGMDPDGAMIATCLGAAIGCLLTAFLSNKPFAMASGMGRTPFSPTRSASATAIPGSRPWPLCSCPACYSWRRF